MIGKSHPISMRVFSPLIPKQSPNCLFLQKTVTDHQIHFIQRRRSQRDQLYTLHLSKSKPHMFAIGKVRLYERLQNGFPKFAYNKSSHFTHRLSSWHKQFLVIGNKLIPIYIYRSLVGIARYFRDTMMNVLPKLNKIRTRRRTS